MSVFEARCKYLEDLWRQHIRSDVPPPPGVLLDRFVHIVNTKDKEQHHGCNG